MRKDILLAITFLALVGCVSQPYPKKNQFMVAFPNLNPEAKHTNKCVIQIASPAVNPAFASTEFVYRVKQNQYIADYYNNFFNPPSEQFLQAMTTWLQAHHNHCIVVSPHSMLTHQYLLQPTILSLYGDYRQSPNAVLEMKFTLYKLTASGYQLKWNKSYAKEIPLDQSHPNLLTQGWIKGLSHILTQLKAQLPSH